MAIATSLRVRSPAATSAVASRLMRRLGISRLREIADRDRLGLPVAVAARPRGATNRLHWGKGVSIDDARTGALMEAVEFAVAENVADRGADFRMPIADLVDLLPAGIEIADFAPRRGADVAPSRRTSAMWCDNLFDGSKVLIPAELVMLPSPDDGGAPPIFGWSSNGLASGNTLDEATLHALFEVLERDAIAMNVGRRVPVEPATLPRWVRNAMDTWRHEGATLTVRSLPSAFDVACFEAVIDEPSHRIAPRATGWGCHDDRDIALARAICEAAQVRLVAITLRGRPLPTGGASSGRTGDSSVRGWTLQAFDPGVRAIGYEEVASRPARAVGVLLDRLMARLQGAGIPAIFRRSMDFDDDPAALGGLRVVKVVVPRCEPGGGRAGPRLGR